MSYIEFENFSAYYKLKKEYVVALDAISLSIEEGEFVTLVGPSGCGKSTLLKCLLGQVELTAGKLRLGGKELTGELVKKSNIAYVGQEFKLYPHLNVFENIAFPLRMSETAPEETNALVRAMAEKCGLGEYLLNRKPRQLSAGQQQRVALARAFVKNPSLVLLDEPFSHLDAPLRGELRELVYRYYLDSGATVLFVTHDEEEARALGGRMLTMDYGVIAASEDTGSFGKALRRKTTAHISEELEKKASVSKGSLRTRLLYRWPVYLLGLAALAFVLTSLWGRLTAPAPNEKLSVSFVGQNFRAEELQEALLADTGAFTEQRLREIGVEALYNDNGALLAESLTVRAIGETDFVILEQDFVIDEIGSRYFSPIPGEIVSRYFPGAVTREENGSVYAIRIWDPGEGESTVFSRYYDGEEPCWLFFTVVSENTAAMNGTGRERDVAALELAAYLWRTEE